MTTELPAKGRQVRVDGSLMTVRDADWAGDGAIELFVLDAGGSPRRVLLSQRELFAGLVPADDRGGDPVRALTGLWGRWMQHALPRIRSAVLATRPLRPYAHQDDAVHCLWGAKSGTQVLNCGDAGPSGGENVYLDSSPNLVVLRARHGPATTSIDPAAASEGRPSTPSMPLTIINAAVRTTTSVSLQPDIAAAHTTYP